MNQKVSIGTVAIGWFALTSASLALAAANTGQAAGRLFGDPAASGIRPSAAQVRAAGVLRSLPGVVEVLPVIVNDRVLRGGDPVDVNPTPGAKAVLLHGRVSVAKTERLIWHGDDGGNGAAAVFVVRDGRVHGTVWAPPRLLEVRPLGSNLHAVLSMDPRVCGGVCPPEGNATGMPLASRQQSPGTYRGLSVPAEGTPDPCMPAPGQVRLACPEEARSEDASIRVLVTYTAAARKAMRDAASEEDVPGDIDSAIELALETTNGSFTDSKVHIVLELAHAYETDYEEAALRPECANLEVDVERLRERCDGFLDEVHRYRDVYEADVAVLLIGWSECYGMASPPILASDSTAFAVVSTIHASSCFTFAHELGHLLGAQHAECLGLAAFECGQGLCEKGWYTIMAKDKECGDLSLFRVGRWSNPSVSYSHPDFPELGAKPTGTRKRNNAAVLNATAGAVAGFRSTGTLVAVPTGLFIGRGSSAGLRAEVRRADESQARRHWVCATSANAGIVSVAEWCEADEAGVAFIAVQGRALGRTVITLRAEGVAVSVRVTVVPRLCSVAVLALLALVAWLTLSKKRAKRDR